MKFKCPNDPKHRMGTGDGLLICADCGFTSSVKLERELRSVGLEMERF